MPKSLKDDLTTVATKVDIIDLSAKLGIETAAAKDFVSFALANTLLMDRKQQDYGPENIAEFGSFGCIVRMSDKHKRLKQLYNNGKRRKVQCETIEDTFRDISNYSIIATMVEQSKWPS